MFVASIATVEVLWHRRFASRSIHNLGFEELLGGESRLKTLTIMKKMIGGNAKIWYRMLVQGRLIHRGRQLQAVMSLSPLETYKH